MWTVVEVLQDMGRDLKGVGGMGTKPKIVQDMGGMSMQSLALNKGLKISNHLLISRTHPLRVSGSGSQPDKAHCAFSYRPHSYKHNAF